MTILSATRRLPLRARFCLVFALWAVAFSLIFERWQSLFASGYMHPVSTVAAVLLNAIGVETRLDAGSLSQGFCLLSMDGLTFRVIFECTGIFPLFIFAAATLAYPASLLQKAQGLVAGFIAFFLYSSLRLVLLGIVGQVMRHWLLLSHLWLMVLINVGFAIFVWLCWLSRVRQGVARHA